MNFSLGEMNNFDLNIDKKKFLLIYTRLNVRVLFVCLSSIKKESFNKKTKITKKK